LLGAYEPTKENNNGVTLYYNIESEMWLEFDSDSKHWMFQNAEHKGKSCGYMASVGISSSNLLPKETCSSTSTWQIYYELKWIEVKSVKITIN
jgi:hypothetical protein